MKRINKSPLPSPVRKRVSLDRIETRPDTFQPRTSLNERHVMELVEVLKRGQDFDPVSIWEEPDTKALVIADGHHRVEAYKRYGKKGLIGAEVFSCPLSSALLIPIRDNAKARLPMSYDERANWAWGLTVRTDHSKATVVSVCVISDGTVSYMRQVKKSLEAKGEELPETWSEARTLAQGKDPKEWSPTDRDEWIQGLVRKADHEFGASLADLTRRCPEAAAELLERCAGGRLEAIMDHLGYVRNGEEEAEEEWF